MAATIIQRRYRKYYNNRFGLDEDNQSNYSARDFAKVMEQRKNNEIYAQRKKRIRIHKLTYCNHFVSMNTARANIETDRILLDSQDGDIRSSPNRRS